MKMYQSKFDTKTNFNNSNKYKSQVDTNAYYIYTNATSLNSSKLNELSLTLEAPVYVYT